MSTKSSIDYSETIFYMLCVCGVLFFITYIGFRSYYIGYEKSKEDIQKELIEQGVMEYDSKTGEIVFIGKENGL